MNKKRPNSRRNLDLALERLVGRENFVAKRNVIASAIVSQMLPTGVVKGGSAIKMRLGDAETRFTTDLDVARNSSLETFEELMKDALTNGWEGFTGNLVMNRQARPENVPIKYLMQPFSVKLAYMDKPWMTIALEVGFDEIGDAEDPDLVFPEDANKMLVALGFPPLAAIPVMALPHQFAQKLHAVTEPSSERAHDLIDLQLLDKVYSGDYSHIKKTCIRLFSYRKMQSWPPTVTANQSWETMYAAQLPNADLIENVDEAVKWTNTLINTIDNA